MEWEKTMTTSKAIHWTERSPEDFLYSIASDFIEDLKDKMRELNMNQSKLARDANVDKSYVSRVLKDPGNLTLETIVKFARTVGMKVSIVPYEDSDSDNERGPIDPSVFRRCWEEKGKPADMWAFPIAPSPRTLDLSAFDKWGGLPFGLNKGIGNRPLDVRKREVTSAINTKMQYYSAQQTQTSDPEVSVDG
jgi:DNA-binding phage protein